MPTDRPVPSCQEQATQTNMDAAEAELQYFVTGGRRFVRPYHFNFKTHVKGRWVGRTLLQVFQQEFPYQPQDYFPKAIASGRLTACTRHGAAIPADVALSQGDAITHVVHRHEPSVVEPAVRIVAHDADVVVVVKSCSIPVHVSGRYRRNTLIHILDLVHGFGNLLNVNRLDRVTSGIVILARNKATARRLTDQIQGDKVVRKEYLAKVVGCFPEGSSGTVVCEAALAVDPRTRSAYVVGKSENGGGKHTSAKTDEVPKVKPARTVFRRLFTDGIASIVHCVPVTGRTHQIRVHLQHLGHPIVDDPLYGPKNQGSLPGGVEPTGDRRSRKRDAAEAGCDANTPSFNRQAGELCSASPDNVGYAATTAKALTSDASTDTSFDPICAHCPAIEPNSEGEADPGDGICLHAFAYSCREWCYVCPADMMPVWATLQPDTIDCLATLRGTTPPTYVVPAEKVNE